MASALAMTKTSGTQPSSAAASTIRPSRGSIGNSASFRPSGVSLGRPTDPSADDRRLRDAAATRVGTPAADPDPDHSVLDDSDVGDPGAGRRTGDWRAAEVSAPSPSSGSMPS